MFGRRNRRNREPSYLPYTYPASYPTPRAYGGQYEVNRNQYYFNPYTPSPNGGSQLNMYPSSPFPYGEPGFNVNMYGNHGNYFAQEGMHQQTYPAEAILQNPLQPKKNKGYNPYMGNSYPYMHPYPKQGMGKRPPSGMNSIINSFKGQDGSLDFNKMIDTAGQMMNAVSQVSGLVKGIGGIFKV